MLRKGLGLSTKLAKINRSSNTVLEACAMSRYGFQAMVNECSKGVSFKNNKIGIRTLARFFGENKGTEKHQFKAETKRLLDIVAKSLYTDSEVFIRELLSNCSDALEKQRYLQISGQSNANGDPLQISISTDEAKRQLIIQDTGIGMTRQELIDNLGTIASSGSKKFVEEVKNLGDGQTYDPESIIGQFGVGFYSVFIVAHTVEVVTRREGETAFKWASDGSGEYSIEEVEDDLRRGTRIKIYLNPDHKVFSKRAEVNKIVSKFSNFISHPIFLDGERTNKVTALWAKSKNDIEDNDYQEFWEHLSKSKIPFKYLLHYTAEMPLQVKSIIYFPNSHAERSGMQQEKLQVSLYSRKVLIKENCAELFPEYLRFLKGVVDCEDLPLNISRENYQDSHLIGRLRGLLTKRVLKHLVDKSKADSSGYGGWYREFSNFIRQGALSDPENKATLINLMRFNSTLGSSITLQQYIEAMKEGQKNIYFMQSLNLEQAKTNPFFEPFIGSEVPVLFLSESIDEMILTDQGKYKNFQMINIESDFEAVKKDLNFTQTKNENGIPENEISSFCLWIKVSSDGVQP